MHDTGYQTGTLGGYPTGSVPIAVVTSERSDTGFKREQFLRFYFFAFGFGSEHQWPPLVSLVRRFHCNFLLLASFPNTNDHRWRRWCNGFNTISLIFFIFLLLALFPNTSGHRWRRWCNGFNAMVLIFLVFS